MEPRNQTDVSEFLLLGLTEDPELQPVLFSLFVSMYLATLLGNLLIVLAVSSASHLHTPMYFFVSSLSFTDICFSTTMIPNMLVNIQAQNHSIIYIGYLTQVCFVLVFTGLDNFLLATVGYDLYVAICHPLIYTTIMNTCLCGLLSLLSLLISIANVLTHSLMVLHLSFCTDLEIPRFFCELDQILKLACSDTIINYILVYFVASFFFFVVVFLSLESFSLTLRLSPLL
ncbi:olfactory receptor 7G2-like [Loxodonta africana]|uniref:olfactory receptor 7G2-like n=1 Tax=Loxodonta africana TaxID=9785 RepID=UPI0030CD23D6